MISRHPLPILSALTFFVGTFLYVNSLSAQTAPPPGVMTGYAWSDTIGWVSLDGKGYGIKVASDGTLSGFGWSENIGWVSSNENDISGCPSAPCKAQIKGNTLTGWLKALSGGSPQSGGWDGWIRLSGPGYGPTMSSGKFSGYSWGSDVVGWVDFSLVRTTYGGTCATGYACMDNAVVQINEKCETQVVEVCEAPKFCSSGLSMCIESSSGDQEIITRRLQAIPALVQQGNPTRLYWEVGNVQGCMVEGTNGEAWESLASDPQGTVTRGLSTETIFTLTCKRLDGTSFTQTTRVDVVPVFREI